MFKCEVVNVYIHPDGLETAVQAKISKIGTKDKRNHPLIENLWTTYPGIERSIRKGDLLRCDGVPYLTKPRNAFKWVKDSNGSKISINMIVNIPAGYKPFKLDSGYWVLRKR